YHNRTIAALQSIHDGVLAIICRALKTVVQVDSKPDKTGGTARDRNCERRGCEADDWVCGITRQRYRLRVGQYFVAGRQAGLAIARIDSCVVVNLNRVRALRHERIRQSDRECDRTR